MYCILIKVLFFFGKIDEVLDLVKDIFFLNNLDKYDFVFLDQSDFDKVWVFCCEEVISSNNVGYLMVIKIVVMVFFIEYYFSKGEDEKVMEIYICLVLEKIEDVFIRLFF